MLALPNQTPNLIETYGLTRTQAEQSVWVIDAVGQHYAGAAAVNRVWRELGGVWRGLSLLYALPILKQIEEAVYAWVAKNRWRF